MATSSNYLTLPWQHTGYKSFNVKKNILNIKFPLRFFLTQKDIDLRIYEGHHDVSGSLGNIESLVVVCESSGVHEHPAFPRGRDAAVVADESAAAALENGRSQSKTYLSTGQSRREVLDKIDFISMIYQVFKCMLTQSTGFY